MTHFELGKSAELRGDLYPDLRGRHLMTLMQEALNRLGSTLAASADALPDGFPAYTRIEGSGRCSQIYVATDHRLFLADFWAKGVQLAKGQSPEIDQIASAVDHWIKQQSTAADLAASYPFVTPGEHAADFEQGHATERRWQSYLHGVATDFPETQAFVRLAYQTPRLRELFPFTSMSWFCFSRCTGYPYTSDCPVVWCSSKGDPTVTVPERGSFEGLTVEEAIEMVLRHLPKNAGPAADGTAEDVDR
jgi:hypothetical protein